MYINSCLMIFIGLMTGSFTSGLHITGTFSNSDFFLFLAKFGFQEVDKNDVVGSQGYIYGNITSDSNMSYDMYLVVVDSQYFLKYYKLKDDKDSPSKCTDMFSKIDEKAWDRFCALNGAEDFLRRVPCSKNSLCVEEKDDPQAVIDKQQFTYHIRDTNQPRFWYISLVACHRPRAQQCQWSYNSSIDLKVSYDIWFVNGDPASKHLNPFEHQFSYEMHDVLEIYFTFLVLNGLLLVIQVCAFKNKKHVLIQLVTGVLALEVAGIFFNLLHITVFAYDGVGVPALVVLGNFIDMCAQCTVMLEILFIGKGWTISSQILSNKILLIVIWCIYTAIYIILFIFNMISVDLITDVDEWQTIPGYCILVFRIIIMMYFLYELQSTFSKEESPVKHKFYIRVGAMFLVWFIYLPIIALISPKIAALWRFKTLLSIQSGADFALLVILVHLFWPSDTVKYFDIPTSGSRQDHQRLVVSDGESSEDELYERQANAHSFNSLNYTYGAGNYQQSELNREDNS